ncbi:mirror-image polydactyly gene 1 protein isoform 2-T3 [Pholidichthys leucotaenia]
MYSANPRVNEELRQRLPSAATQRLGSPDRSEISLNLDLWPPQAPHNQELPTTRLPSPMSHRRSPPLVSPSPQRRSASPAGPLGEMGEMEADLSPSREPSPGAEMGGREGVSPTVRGQQRDSLLHVSAVTPDKNVSFLLKELDALRGLNNKLQEQLLSKEQELQRREVQEELREEQREAQNWERPAAVLEEVLAAQKDRDQALMSRLLLANEERDEALLRTRQLQQAAQSNGPHLDGSEQDVDELLGGIFNADSAQDVCRFGSGLVHRLQSAWRRRSDITAEEMRAVMEERDRAMTQSRRLEQEVLQKNQQWTSEEVVQLQKERDDALVDLQRLEAEIEELRADHSFQDQVPPSKTPSPSDGPSPAAGLQTSALMVQLQQLKKEKQRVEAELQRCQENEREASERVRRLERLVEVLRKKVGAGSVHAVI